MKGRAIRTAACWVWLSACASQNAAINSGNVDGEALAKEVHEAAGAPALSSIAMVSFRFVVERGDELVFEAKHTWDRLGRRDRVRWMGSQGRKIDALVSLDTKRAQVWVDGVAASREQSEALQAKAYGRWVNDVYWLFFPLKLMDPGVIKTREQDRVLNGHTYRILRLNFLNVGLTPGDVYWLFITEAGEVARWEMSLQGQEAPARGGDFTRIQRVGPLRLGTEYVGDRFTKKPETRIRLLDVEVASEVDPARFAAPESARKPDVRDAGGKL